MSWWELRARVAGQVQALGGPGVAPPTPEEFDDVVARFADV